MTNCYGRDPSNLFEESINLIVLSIIWKAYSNKIKGYLHWEKFFHIN